MKKSLPTILDIVLRPEVFLNASFLTESTATKNRILTNDIPDEDYYNDDVEDKEYVIATLDELYDQVNDIYDELYDNAEPTQLQNNNGNKLTITPTESENGKTDDSTDTKKDDIPFVFPQVKSNLNVAEIEELEYVEGSGQNGKEQTVFPTKSTRIEFPRTLDNFKPNVETDQNNLDNDYPDMDMPVSNALKDVEVKIEVSHHNRLFPTPPATGTNIKEGLDYDDVEQASFRNNLITPKSDNDGDTCFCPCKCTKSHQDSSANVNLDTIENSRTSPQTPR